MLAKRRWKCKIVDVKTCRNHVRDGSCGGGGGAGRANISNHWLLIPIKGILYDTVHSNAVGMLVVGKKGGIGARGVYTRVFLTVRLTLSLDLGKL